MDRLKLPITANPRNWYVEDSAVYFTLVTRVASRSPRSFLQASARFVVTVLRKAPPLTAKF
ncbi:MAG: hypothetical protein IPI49_09630 [Myxococcales bacterium]|nr:hypothetical protein [Myxococcales bacterium]